MYKQWCSLTLLGLLVVSVRSYPTGAPLSACNDSGPGHNATEQNGPSPFTITTSSESVVSGGKVDVTISTTVEGEFFRGYMLQAREPNTKKRLGSFSSVGEGHFLDCPGGEKNAATHSERADKTSVTFQWTAPSDFTGTVVFDASIVKTYKEFWNGVKSSPIQVVSSSGQALKHEPVQNS